MLDQALEGKDVKDLLLNVGSGGGAAAPAAGGPTAGGDAPAAEEKKEEKEEGKSNSIVKLGCESLMILLQRKKNPTRTWASVYSTKRAIPPNFFFILHPARPEYVQMSCSEFEKVEFTIMGSFQHARIMPKVMPRCV